MSLAHRYAVAFLLVLLVSGAVLAVTFTAHRTDVAEGTEATVADRAAQSATILDGRIQAHRQTVAVGAADPTLAAHGTPRQRRALEAFVDRSAFEGASVVDETGRVQWLVTGHGESMDVMEMNISDREYVQRTLEGEQYVSEPFVAETGNRVVAIAAPIRADGEVVGALTGTYHLHGTDLFEPLRDERAATTVEADDEVVFSTVAGTDGAGTEDESGDENGNGIEIGGVGESDPITAEAALETVDWTVTVRRDRAAITTPLADLLALQVVSGVTLLGSVIAFGIWVYRSQVRRIGRLLERVRALERREYEAGPSIGGAAEWRRIDDALARLGGTLGRREQMLLVLNRILRHNLRNTLNVIIGRASDLEASLEGDDREAATEIRRTAKDLLELGNRARLTEELLDPVAAEGGDGTPRTDVATLVRERAAGFTASTGAGETGHCRSLENVTVSGPDRAVAACGDEIAIAIDELLANVVDHAGASPTVAVTVDLDVETDRILVIVADDGPGIPADEVSVITGERAISQVNHTGGIGLWLVDWICSRYDGRLVIPHGGAANAGGREPDTDRNATTVDGEADDRDANSGGGLQGATVVLELPLASENESDPAGGSVPAGV
ncbi:sensor histidine kinase [Halopiger xanaduensis]|uniref:histidine kinase n=1 Tax=Halopiger xanaduensis (strain DSM 18323 / JCM 14033 / SH-6) TaxID=797210 RepID=F8DBU8_HALXS|nr:ATP-binding protein [Halopiger xanaduensis]AEH38907.1 ATP-binding region ATPase domain protein [Halopiger xanaduensis SH-6]